MHVKHRRRREHGEVQVVRHHELVSVCSQGDFRETRGSVQNESDLRNTWRPAQNKVHLIVFWEQSPQRNSLRVPDDGKIVRITRGQEASPQIPSKS